MRSDYQKRLDRIKAAKKARKFAAEFVDGLDIKHHIAEVYYPLHDDIEAGAHTTYNLPGGRGSCKSSFVSLEIVKGIMQDPTGRTNAIVFRLVAETMGDSVFSQIQWAIDTLEADHLWESTVKPMRHRYLPTGAEIVYKGLDKPTKLKSIKPRQGFFKYIWLEEFAELPGPNFLRSVMQSVMRGKSKFTVFRSFNPPISANNWANQYIALPDPKAVTLLTDYTMIPPEWLGDAFLYEAERLKELNPTAYQHEYLGLPTGTGGEVFPNIEIRAITDDEVNQMEYIYQGIDFGFAVDPACFMRVGYDRKRDTVYFLDEIYKRQCSNKQLAQLIKDKGYDRTGKPGYVSLYMLDSIQQERARIVCDAAEPKSIADLNSEGLKCAPCKKFPGCVEYRIKWLQHRKIVIDPKRTPEAYKEFVNYEYATDKDGNFMSVLPDKNNHSIDAVAYALNSVIYVKGSNGVSA